MSDDLAKEIASSALGIGWLDTESAARKVAKHSADRIEELTVKNKQLEDELDHAQKWEAALLADFAELKAKLAKAVDGLKHLAYLQSGNPCTGIQAEKWLSDARATLAELTGGNDE